MEKKNNTFEEIWQKLKSCKRVLIKLHDGPDGDCLGCCAAMAYVLREQGVEVRLISKDNLSENLTDFKFVKEIEFGKTLRDIDLKNFDVIIFLDHGSPTYDGVDIEDLLKENFIVNIDHHGSNQYYGQLNYVDAKAPSCCSILVEFFKKMNIEFDKELSSMLFLGICTDTGFFKRDSVASMGDAIFLIEKGDINYELEFFNQINNQEWGLKKLHGILLSNMEKKEIEGNIIAYSFVTKEEAEKYNLNLSGIRLGIICMQDIMGVDVAFNLIESEDKIKGSFRSSDVDTLLFSEMLGGGGHKGASGFVIEKVPMEKAVERVFETIRKVGIHKV